MLDDTKAIGLTPGCDEDRNATIMEFQQKFASPMPWIGVYIAGASLVCTIAMAIDVFCAFRMKKLWFPCKFFTLNATSLTLLAVAMKLPLDITTFMMGYVDQLAKLSGSIFMTAVIGNFMTSLGCMNGQVLIMNITAATILVITIIVNICIQMSTEAVASNWWCEETVVTFFMFVLLLVLSFSALAVPATKKYLEVKYHQRLDEEELVENGKLTTKTFETAVKKFWMMAETSNPQFVMVRSVMCTTSGLICLLNALILLEVWIRPFIAYRFSDARNSDYAWSTMCVLVIQSIGVGIGTISPVMRWFLAVSFKCSEKRSRKYKNKLKIEPYWIEKLIAWKQRPLPLRIGGWKTRKFLQYMKILILDIFISVQVVIVMVNKLVLLISVSLVSPIYSCFYHIKRLKMEDVSESGATDQHREQESELGTKLDLRRYVLLLEGEPELPMRTLNRIFYDVDQLIQTGKKHQPKNLFKLLKKSCSFNGLKHFDRAQVLSMHPEEPPNCWTLPVVTLTIIAIAIASPNVETHLIDQLISSVTEGIRYARLVDKSLEGKRNSENVINTAYEVWVKVELYRRWLDEDLVTTSHDQAGKTSGEILQKLSRIAEESLVEFKKNMEGSVMGNPPNWPVRIVAANSMYRISNTILLMHEEMNKQVDDEGLFNHLCIMIADILFACLTNLPHVIIQKGYNNMIEEREESIRHAARLLGEIEDILKLFESREIPSLDPDKAVDIDEWRALIFQENPLAFISTSDNSTASTQSCEEHVTVDIGT